MNKITLNIIILLVTSLSYSQIAYFNYLDNTSEWRYYGGGWNGLNGYDYYQTTYFDGYETINGNNYYKQYSIKIETNYDHPFQGTYSETFNYGPTYVREDNSGKFYYFDLNNNTEYILFDNQQIIDSEIGNQYPLNGSSCNIESIETLYLGTTQLKRIKGSVTGTNVGASEGIGHIGASCGIGIEFSSWLNCYTKQNEILQFSTINCNLFPSPVRTNLNEETNNFIKNNFIVFPNPSNGIINIKTSLYFRNLEYEISNVVGKIITKGLLDSENKQVDLSSFENGMYVLKITNQESTEYKKIIKK